MRDDNPGSGISIPRVIQKQNITTDLLYSLAGCLFCVLASSMFKRLKGLPYGMLDQGVLTISNANAAVNKRMQSKDLSVDVG